MNFIKGLSVFTLTIFVGALGWSKDHHILSDIEKQYQHAKTIQMDVTKKLKIELLNKEKISEGSIKIKKNGKFKWQVNSPEKSMILLTPSSIWAVDFPADPGDKVVVLKSKKPKKNQSPAVVAFLMGEGNISKNFEVLSSKPLDSENTEIHLKPRSTGEVVKDLTLYVKSKQKRIHKFIDSVGNTTELEFKNIVFDAPISSEEFKFVPPKNSDISSID